MVKPIVHNINELRKPCELVAENEDVSQIILDLKDTLATKKGYALTANQLGYRKCVVYIKMISKINPTGIEYKEVVAINPKIIEKSNKIVLQKEACLSFPGIYINTDRWVFCTIEYEDEKRQKHTELAQDLVSFVWQHEVDHCLGLTLIDAKHRRRR